MTRDDLLWLVKSSGRIIGPYPTAKVAELLRTREISVLDEISPPSRRWQTLQYHDEFREVVDSLRKASLSERTEVTWSPGTNGLTQTLTDVSAGGELTEDLGHVNLDSFSDPAKEIVLHDVPEQSSSKPSGPPTIGRYQPPQNQNTAIERQVEKTTRGLWFLTTLILLLAAGYILQRKMSAGSFDGRPATATIKQSVIAKVQIGHYAEALKELKSFYTDPMQSGEMAIYFSSLLIQVENQTVLGRRLLNLVLAAHKGDNKQALTGLGVADLIDGQLDAAQDGFDKALAQDAEYVPAIVDQAAVALQKGDYARVKTLTTRALALSPLQGEALALWAEAEINLFKSSNNPADLNLVARRIADYRTHSWDFAAELGLFDLQIARLTQSPKFEDKLQAYLDLDPRITVDHRHNVFIYRGRLQWNVLARACEQLSDQLGETAHAATLKAACQAREGRWDQARRAIDKAVNLAGKDPIAQAWYSYILRESGDGDQAGVVLGRATEFNRRGEAILPTLMQARFCQSAGLVECAHDNWKNLFEHDMDYLPAVAGMAWLSVQGKNNAEALKQINRGLRLSPDYIPLLELKQKAETEGWYAAN